VATSLTSRVGSAPSADTTKRVFTQSASAGSGTSIGGDTWGGTWGGTWARCWYNATAASDATDASPAIDVTQRITAAATANNTKRVTL
jgi:hypothetical protein